MKEWIQIKLSDLGDVVGGATPSTKNEVYYGGDVAWITPKDLSNFSGRFISRGERNITELGLKSCSAKLLPKNTVLFTSRAPIGYVAISSKEVATNQGFKSIVPNKNTDYLFLYYLLIFYKNKIVSMGSGTTFKEVSGATMKNIEVYVPQDKKEQAKIGKILSSLDDKIECNNRMNTVLEEIARALFHRWFVEFEFPNADGKPYQSAGGKMVESEMGSVPEGWEVGTIGDVVQILGGSTPDTKNPVFWENGENPFCTPKDLSTLISPILLDTERHITEEGVQSISSKHLPAGTLLLSSRAPVGYLAISSVPVSINQGFIAMICDKEISNVFLLQWLRKNMGIIEGRANGSTFQEISKRNFRTIPFLIPSVDVLMRYNSIVKPLYNQITTLTKESVEISGVRDTLLTKLMSGEIEI
ncbi:restriction endonuclease subunit S [Methanogenium cariaci]|jgi:type I restriction enzyme, S subunit